MPKVDLREKVASVRSKAGLAGTDFLATWRQVNVKAQEISLAENGPISLVKGAKTLSPITKLKEHYAEPKDGEDEKARLKIVDALEVEGAAAWIVHTAIKANYDKHVRNTKQSSVPGHSPAGVGTASDAGPSNDARSRSRSTMFDPARDV